MRTVRLDGETDFGGWRRAARALAAEGVPPFDVTWTVTGGHDLFAADASAPAAGACGVTVPATFLALAETVVLHRDPQRFGLLYTLLWRLRRERGLMEVGVDPLVAKLDRMARSVRRDIHKMHAFVRFREVRGEREPHYVAWFEPDHHIVAAAAPFFQRRFAAMRWSILTPEQSAHWNGMNLVIGGGAPKPPAAADGAEDLWRTYYASIFNPARLKVDMMRSEMPRKYWKNLPEAPLIKPLVEAAAGRASAMVGAEASPANVRPQRQEHFMGKSAPAHEAGTIAALRAEAAHCKACPLWKPATQTVFGEGPANAEIVLVGEQPGDKEDLAGRPFVGPAGLLLDKALAEAGIDRERLYVTNAVKHFKFTPRGKRRLHQKPDSGEIEACRFWLDREFAVLKPRLVVSLGATALQSLAGKAMPINRNRGRIIRLNGLAVLPTVHPSYLLRLLDEAVRAKEYDRFVEDLKLML
ncbi:MAG: UdgX family uracil-DNA binding protein [Sphingomonadales bacterium]